MASSIQVAELQKIVVEFKIVERPLSSKRPDQSVAYKVPHQGGLATTADGQNYLIEKGVAPDDLDEFYRIGDAKGSRIVRIGKMLPPGFVVVKSVDVESDDATLMDLLQASGKEYSWLCQNCWNSTESMKQVLTDKLQLPWQLEAGVAVGVIGVFVMALFIIGKLFLGGGAMVRLVKW